MDWKRTLRREKHIVIHGQSSKFRLAKYAVLLALLIPFYLWNGGVASAWLLAALIVVSLCVHFLFRWKTKAWTQSWGPYRKIDLPE